MKRLLRSAAIQSVLAFAVATYIELLIHTLRWRIEGRESVDRAMGRPQGVLALFWHGRIAQGIACRPLLAGKPRRVMISFSRDGGFIARAAERLKIPVIRGSTGRRGGDKAEDKRGAAAFREALGFIRSGGVMILTPDGPRGPAEILPLGPARLAAAAAAPTFLMSLAARPAIRLASWDRARIPLPFARAAVVLEGPLPPPAGGEAALAATRADWEGRLRAGQERAEALLGPAGARS